MSMNEFREFLRIVLMIGGAVFWFIIVCFVAVWGAYLVARIKWWWGSRRMI